MFYNPLDIYGAFLHTSNAWPGRGIQLESTKMAGDLEHLKRLFSTKPVEASDQITSTDEDDVSVDEPLQDCDPEDMDFGGHADRTSASSRKRSTMVDYADESRAHYRDLSVAGNRIKKTCLPIDSKDFMDGKYAGQKTSRAELGFTLEAASDSQELVDGDEEEDRFSYSTRDVSRFDALDDNEDIQLQMVARKLNDDKERGRHVQLQLQKWQGALDVRVRLQPLLTMSQRVPAVQEWQALCGEDVEGVPASKDAAEKELSGLVASLIGHVSSLGGLTRPKDEVAVQTLQEQEKTLRQLDAACSTLWKASLDHWHQKVAFTVEGASAKKQLKVINQSLWTQVESSFRDKERLVRRALTRRSATMPFTESEREVPAFDDADFFSTVVRNWVETGADTKGHVALAAGLVVRKVKESKRAGIDPRTSKGRKLRYDVQDKIVNFMVPVKELNAWTDDKIDTFFASIFPQVETVDIE